MSVITDPISAVRAPSALRVQVVGSSKCRRLVAAIAMGCSLAVLLVAAWLTPSPRGMGTHESLNLPRCGWIVVADLPCPTCGMTTAFAHAANGNLVASFMAQPLGCLLALATAMALLVSVHVVVTGSRIASAFSGLLAGKSLWLLSALVVASWGYKIVAYKGWLF